MACTFCCRELRSGALVGRQGELVKGVLYSRPRFKDAHLKSTPRFKDGIFSKSKVPPQIYNYHRGVAFLRHGAPKITAVVHLQSCTESGLLLLTLLRAGMERFLPSASGSSAAGLKFCPFWYIAFDRRCIVFVATAVWLFFGC